MNKPDDICKDCGLARREHHHDGNAYGLCGQFSEIAHSANPRCIMNDREATTLYLERSKVRSLLIGHADEDMNLTELILHDIDELPIFTAADLGSVAQGAVPCGAPVAFTNEAQIGFLEHPNYVGIPMAMWAKSSASHPIALYASPAQSSWQPTDEMLNAHLKATGEWVNPFAAEFDGGCQISDELTQEDADRINADSRDQLRKGYVAAYSVTSTKSGGAA